MPHNIRDQIDAGERTYGELLDVQTAELKLWAGKLSVPCFNALHEHCCKLNTVSGKNGFHRVPTGLDLTEFVNQWFKK